MTEQTIDQIIAAMKGLKPKERKILRSQAMAGNPRAIMVLTAARRRHGV